MPIAVLKTSQDAHKQDDEGWWNQDVENQQDLNMTLKFEKSRIETQQFFGDRWRYTTSRYIYLTRCMNRYQWAEFPEKVEVNNEGDLRTTIVKVLKSLFKAIRRS
jgi:hypothetical protein